MAKGMKCDNCGKGIMYGHNVSHAKNRTRRIFKPNLHSARILIGAGYKTMRLCTKCLRLLKGKAKKATNVEEAPQDQTPVAVAS
jgi:large subunit ribosomal protein L28